MRKKSAHDDATRYEEDDACILAVMALFQLQKLQEEEGVGGAGVPLVRAAAILIRASQTSPKNQDILQLWVRLFLHLGLPSLALGSFRALRIKEMLNETLAHLIFTRISTQQPFPAKFNNDADKFDPRKELKGVLDYYLKAIKQANKYLGANGNATQPDTLVEFQELKSSFQDSFTRKLCLLERRRIERISGLDCDTEGYIESFRGTQCCS
jgi:N-terminal acetyltransferase B complex non-catalytic subunit